jgi:hypothetical protein
LPRFSRSTTKQSRHSNQFRELIKLSEVRPQEAIDGIYRLTDSGMDREVLIKLRSENEFFLEQHRKNLEKRIYQLLQVESYKGLRHFAESQKGIIQHKSKLISAVLKSNENDWVDLVAESLVGVPRESWSDATDEVFETELGNEITSNSQNNYHDLYIELRTEEGSFLIPKIELSDKSQLIYENVKRTLQFTGRTVPKEELRVVLWKLLREASFNEDLKIKDTGGSR